MSGAAQQPRERVIVLGSHPLHGYSMNRYTQLLVEAYRRAGWKVRLVRPTSKLSRRFGNAALRKLLIYIENLPFFGLRLLFLRSGRTPVHVADHSDALWLCLPWRPQVTMVTCHDLIAVRAAVGEIPEHRTRWTGRMYQSFVQRGLRNAGRVLSVSAATEADVRRLVGGAHTAVLHNPISPSMDPAHEPYTSVAAAVPYLLIVSSVGWRKRREHALAVWAHVALAGGEPLDLVLVGPQLTARERAVVDSYGAPGDVRVETAVDDSFLMGLYSGARAVVQVSLYEGFGWPVVEGNIHGTAVICADLPVLREIGPDNVFVGEELDLVDWSAVRAAIQSPTRSAAVRAFAQRYRMDNFSSELTRQAEAVKI